MLLYMLETLKLNTHAGLWHGQGMAEKEETSQGTRKATAEDSWRPSLRIGLLT